MVRLYQEEKSKFKYLILIASFFDHLVIWGVAYGTGVFQVIFLEEFVNSATSGTTSIVTSLVTTLTHFAGPLSSILTNRYGCRIVSWIGTLVAFVGMFLTSQVTMFWHLYFTFSLIGIGFGIAYIPSVIVICQYFERKRPIAMSLACVGLGVGTLTIPLLVRYLVNIYHWRNAVLILSGVILNLLVCGSLFRPVQTLSTQSTPVRKKVIRVKMLRQLSFWCLLMNVLLVMFGLITFFIHLPAYLGTIGYSDDEGASFVSFIGVGTIVGRLIIGIVNQWLKKPIILYVLTMGMSGAMVIMVPFFVHSASLSVCSVLFGLCSSTIGPLLPLILAELVGVDAVADGYGYVLVFGGIGSLLGPPIAGILYDFTRTYLLSMVLTGSVLIFASVIMLPAWVAFKKKNSNEAEISETRTESLSTVNRTM